MQTRTYIIRFSPGYGLPDKEVEATDYTRDDEEITFNDEQGRPFYRVNKHCVMSVEIKK